MKIISKNFIEQEIKNTGFSPEYLEAGILKHKFLNLKIFDLRAVEANILKQTALSCGCDGAVHKYTIECKVEKTDCLLSGTHSQLIEVSKKLRKQPFGLPKLADEILKQIEYTKRHSDTQIMGILNLTDDSFSDGGEYIEFNKAIKHAEEMITQGAKIIDIGAESTRPGATAVKQETEVKYILPVLKYLKENYPEIIISVDTRNSATAASALENGANIINDVSGLRYDSQMAKTAAKYNTQIVITHSRSTPEDMNNHCNYENIVDEVYKELKSQCNYAINEGIKPENIIIDPGFGFAKNYEQNIEILKRIEEFKSLGYKILAGVSRKSFLQTLGSCTVKDADEITAYVSAYLASCEIDYIRVHNVEKNLAAIKFGKIFTQ